jgi:uncharacterized protein (DUF1330 family)
MTGSFENAVYPQADQIAAMQSGETGPIVMVNLLKFRARAAYRDGRQATLSGRDAYMIYGAEVGKLVAKHGGKVLYAGDTSFLMLGRVEPLWDEVALAWYPSRRALLEMSMSPDWMAIAVHRDAGLEGQLNIETTPTYLPPGLAP